MVDGWSLGQVLAWWFLSQDYGPGFYSLHFIFWSIDAGWLETWTRSGWVVSFSRLWYGWTTGHWMVLRQGLASRFPFQDSGLIDDWSLGLGLLTAFLLVAVDAGRPKARQGLLGFSFPRLWHGWRACQWALGQGWVVVCFIRTLIMVDD